MTGQNNRQRRIRVYLLCLAVLFVSAIQGISGAESGRVPVITVENQIGQIEEDPGFQGFNPEDTEIAVPAAAGGDLVTAYVERTMKEVRPGRASRSPRNVGDRLSDTEKKLYNALREAVSKVAAGESTSTVFTFACTDILDKVEFTAEDLGLETLAEVIVDVDDAGSPTVREQLTEEARNALMDIIKSVNVVRVVNALFADCPYELYWQNKEYSIQVQFPSIARRTEAGTTKSALIRNSYKLSFAVSLNYAPAGSTSPAYVVDASYGQSAAQAVENARAILDTYASCSDMEKIKGYFTEILNRTSYDYNASAGAAYGNPWQMIWVFDDDTTNKVVCEGYAKAFQFLCDNTVFDTPDLTVISPTGTLRVDTRSSEAHMWNVVTLNGRNYLMDVTNCDEGTIGTPNLLYMRGFTSGSVSEGYRFACKGSTLLYTYDATSMSLYNEDELEMSDLWLLDRGNLTDTIQYELTRTQADAIVLTLTGSGRIPARDDGYPWEDRVGSITLCVLGEGITGIGEGMFKGGGLREIQLPDSLLSIGAEAFSGASSLRTITLPAGLKDIGEKAFYDTGSLRDLEIPAGIETIGEGAFWRSAARLTLSGENPVYSCADGLLINQDTMTVLRGNAETLIVPEGIVSTEDGAFQKTDVKTIQLPSTLIVLPAEAFAGCSLLRQVTFAEGLEEIGEAAFKNTMLTGSLVIPASVKKIGAGAFEGTRLTDISFPGTETEVTGSITGETGAVLKASVNSLTAKSLSHFHERFTDRENENMQYVWAFRESGENWTEAYETAAADPDAQWLVLLACSASGKAEIPSGVNVIGEKALYGNAAVTEIAFPDTLRVIGTSACENMTKLTEVSLPDGTRVLGDRAFAGCTALETVLLPENLAVVGDGVLQGSLKVDSITLPDHLTAVGSSLLTSAEQLVYARPDSDTARALGGLSFFVDRDHPEYRYRWLNEGTTVQLSDTESREVEAEGLELALYTGNETRVSLAEGCVSIGAQAFCWRDQETGAWKKNSTLQELVCPEGMKAIGAYALYGAGALKKLTFSGDLNCVGMYAFSGCPLTDMSDASSVAYFGTNAFSDTLLASVSVGPDAAFGQEAFTLPARITTQLDSSLSASLSGAGIPFYVEEPAELKDCALLYLDAAEGTGDLCLAAYTGAAAFITVPERLKDVLDKADTGDARLICDPDSDMARNISGKQKADGTPQGFTTGQTDLFDYRWQGDALQLIRYTGSEEVITELPEIADTLLGCSLDGRTLVLEASSHGAQLLKNTGYAFLDPTDRGLSMNWQDGKLVLHTYTGTASSVRVPDGVEKIAEGAFKDHTGLTEVLLPDTLAEIGDQAFLNTGLSELKVPDGVTALGSRVLSAGKLYLPDSMVSLGDQTDLTYEQYMIHAGSATAILRGGENGKDAWEKAAFRDPDDGNLYAWLDGKLYLLQAVSGTSLRSDLYGMLDHTLTGIAGTVLVLPDTFRDFWVQEGNSFFEGPVETVVFPDGLTVIPKNTAGSCTDLKTVVIPASVTDIHDEAFSGSLATVYGYRDTEAEAFAGRLGLTFVEMDGDLEDDIVLAAASELLLLHVDEEIPLKDTVTMESEILVDVSLSAETDGTGILTAEDGRLKGIKPGSGQASVYVTDHKGTAVTIRVKVLNNVADFGVPENAYVDIAAGGADFEIAYMEPEDADSDFVWTLSEQTKTGRQVWLDVTEKGTETVKVTSHNGIVREFAVTGYETLGRLNMTCASSLKTGQAADVQVQLEVDGTFADNPAQLYTLSSSDESVVSVEDGRLIAVSAGSAVITARHLQGGETQVTLTVTDPLEVKLPGSLKEIGEEAFIGIHAEKVVVPSGTERIASRAFAESDILLVEIPASVKEIAEDAFENALSIRILCPAGSTAETYARSHGMDVGLK